MRDQIRGHNVGMLRAVLLTLLAASFVFAGSLQAQRGGGSIRGGTSQASFGSGFGHHVPGHSRFHDDRFHNSRNDTFYPVLDFDPFWYDEPYYDEPNDNAAALPASPVMILQSGDSRSARNETPAPVVPKVIELPGTANSAAFKPLPSAMFILTNGERLEVRRYLLTHDRLYLTIDHQQRTIPLAMLDIRATIAANHERGIEVRIPADHSEISLSF